MMKVEKRSIVGKVMGRVLSVPPEKIDEAQPG